MVLSVLITGTKNGFSLGDRSLTVLHMVSALMANNLSTTICKRAHRRRKKSKANPKLPSDFSKRRRGDSCPQWQRRSRKFEFIKIKASLAGEGR